MLAVCVSGALGFVFGLTTGFPTYSVGYGLAGFVLALSTYLVDIGLP